MDGIIANRWTDGCVIRRRPTYTCMRFIVKVLVVFPLKSKSGRHIMTYIHPEFHGWLGGWVVMWVGGWVGVINYMDELM